MQPPATRLTRCRPQGVDTSSCFERSDLEAKWATLSEASRAAAAAATASASASASAAEERSNDASVPPPDPFAWPREQAERLSAFAAEQQRAAADAVSGLVNGEAAASARSRLAELDESWGVSAKVREVAAQLDRRLGLGEALRSKGPGAWRAFNEARETPLGQAAQFIFTTWLFLSGAFWTLLSWCFLAYFVVNLVAPNLLRDALEDAVTSAAAAARAAGGAGGMPGATPGVRPQEGPAKRRDFSAGDGRVVDVDVVKDAKKNK